MLWGCITGVQCIHCSALECVQLYYRWKSAIRRKHKARVVVIHWKWKWRILFCCRAVNELSVRFHWPQSFAIMMMWENESPSSLKSPLLGPNIPRRRLGHWLYQILGPAMGKHPALLYLSIALSAVGGFLFGYDTGVIAGAMPLIERDVIFWGEKGSGG